MRCTVGYHRVVQAAAIALLLGSTALAVPYASGVRDIGAAGGDWEFILNEAADNVTVVRDGGNPQDLGALAPGRHMFDMTGFTNFEIQVEKSAPVGWTSIGGPSNPFANFTGPTGLAINGDPSSPYFGTVYVGNSSTTATVLGRPQALGIYPLTADLTGVDLTNFMEINDPNDTSQAKAPAEWTLTEVDTGATPTPLTLRSPWRMSLDEAGNLIVADATTISGGLKYGSPDLASGGLVLDIQDGLRPLLLNSENEELHGRIVSKPIVSGSVGNNLTVTALDADYDEDGDTLNNISFQSLWRWDVGNATAYDQPPEMVVSSSALAAQSTWISSVSNVRVSADYSPLHEKWYISEYRFNGTQSGLLVVTPDGVDGTSPTVEFDSYQWSQDNNLDGFAGFGGVEDVFRLTGDVMVSPDGSKLFIHRIGDFNDNPALPTRGVVLIVPLDANGLPVLEIDDNGTPGDPSDDTLGNVEQITISGNNGAHTSGTAIEFDAAGNLYTTNSATSEGGQTLEVFTPGGNTLARTSSAGTFVVDILAPPMGLPGDYNQDNIVNAADYTVWQDRFGDSASLPNDDTAGVGQDDFDRWIMHFGDTAPGGGLGAGAVPEPATLVLAAFGLLAAGLLRRRAA